MEFTASNGKIVDEYELQYELSKTIKGLKNKNEFVIFPWEKEFLEWYLDRKVGEQTNKENIPYIQLYQHITEEELEQLEQLSDYLEL